MGRSVFLVLVIIGILLKVVQGRLGLFSYGYNVTGCPEDCVCTHRVSYNHMGPLDGHFINRGISITDCQSDPYDGLLKIIESDPYIDDLVIEGSLGHTNGTAGYMTKVLNAIGQLRLRVLGIPRNNLTELPENIGDLSWLLRLDVSNNKLEKLPSTFGRLSLKELDLSYNRLMEVDISSILGTSHMHAYFRHNLIETLGTIPTGEPNFTRLDLSSNRLTSIDAWFFRLGVLSNPGITLWRRNTMRVVDVSHNFISNLTNDKGDSLPDTPPWSKSHALWKLDLSHNKVRYLHEISMVLNISHRELIYLIITQHLHLGNNPFSCDCKDYSIYKNIRYDPLPPALVCATPTRLKGLRATSLGLGEFVCNVTKYCPDDCLCTQIPYNMSLNIYCTEYKEIHLPMQVPDLPHSYSYQLHFDDGFLKNLSYRSYISHTASVSFRNNQIAYISSDFFDDCRLKVVDLRKNQLTVVDVWPLMLMFHQDEAQIYLDGNDISEFRNTKVFNPNLEYRSFHRKSLFHILLSLKGNKIAHFSAIAKPWNLTAMIVQDLIEESVLVVTGNPLFCDCVDFDIYELVHYKHNITCAKPPELEGEEITKVNRNQFKCILDEGCPDGCTCTDIPGAYHRRGLLTVRCRNYTNTTLPDSLPRPRNPNAEFYYEIDFDGCSLTTLDNRDYLPLVINASFSHNNISVVNHDFFKDFKRYDVVKLDNNHFQTIPPYIVNRPYLLMFLGHNEWNCSCDNEYTIKWVHANQKEMGDYVNVTCYEPDYFRGKGFDEVNEYLCADVVDESWINTLLIVLIVLFSLTLLTFWLLYVMRVWIYKTFRLYPYEGLVDVLKEFDIFVSYAPDDSEYVEDYLVPRLEEMGFSICHDRAHFPKRESLIWNIHVAIMKSERTVAFLSNAYLGNEDCMQEFYTALTLQIDDGDNSLVSIKDTDVDIRMLEIDIRSYFEQYTYVELESPQFWDNLLYALQLEMSPLSKEDEDEDENIDEIEMVALLGKK